MAVAAGWMIDRQVSVSDLESYDIREIELRRPLPVLNVTGEHLNRLGLDASKTTVRTSNFSSCLALL